MSRKRISSTLHIKDLMFTALLQVAASLLLSSVSCQPSNTMNVTCTWMAGPSTPNQLPAYGGSSALSTPGGRYGFCAVGSTTGPDTMYLFGGHTSTDCKISSNSSYNTQMVTFGCRMSRRRGGPIFAHPTLNTLVVRWAFLLPQPFLDASTCTAVPHLHLMVMLTSLVDFTTTCRRTTCGATVRR